MRGLRDEARHFTAERREERRGAARLVAFRLATGLDLAAALAARSGERRLTILRVRRLLERERLRGAARHWSYDINRHIALKEALDALCRAEATGLST
ncbi:MAG: cytoplasmic protein [Aliihoeflea sp.]